MAIRFMKEIETFEELQEMSWSGAFQTLRRVEEKGLEEELMNLLEEIAMDTPFESDTQLNDFIWFDLENYEPFNKMWGDEEDEDEEE